VDSNGYSDPMRYIFRVHAVRRMFERRISRDDVRHVVEYGRVVEDYPDDKPYPSRLMLGYCGEKPIHVVLADNFSADERIIITAYEPDPKQWDAHFMRRNP